MVGPPGIEIREEPVSALASYGEVSIAFDVDSVFDVSESTRGLVLTERRLETPWRKDYDGSIGERPARWLERFDLTNWAVLAAYREGRRVGGAVVATDTPGVDMLEGRTDLAVLWDIRVAPGERGRGVGTALFAAAEAWAAGRGCRELKIETQDVNVPACRFYEAMGCRLAAVRRGVYAEFPDEAQLIWRKDLAGGSSG